jgi:hypothetical protein
MGIETGSTGDDSAVAFVEQLLHTAFSLGGAYVSLLEDLAESAFNEEDKAAALIEVFAASARPAVQAAGERDCRVATRLIVAVGDRVLEDLRTAERLAGGDG